MALRQNTIHTLVLAFITVCGILLPGTTFAQESAAAIIASPTDGQQLFGLVTITGTAIAPDFVNYRLEYDDLRDPQEQWFLVQAVVTQQVVNDVLGAWNTSVIPDGNYRLRLRVSRLDGTSIETIIPDLRVSNSAPTPIPTVAGVPATETFGAPTPGPSPTSLVQQPPGAPLAQSDNTEPLATLDTNTVIDSGSSMANSASQANGETRVNLDRVQRAFCSGTYIALAAFGMMVIYIVLRDRIR